ncbi:MAG: nucleoside-diphosphate sugar epimerase/dehydratase [Pirellulaceae bacterium]
MSWIDVESHSKIQNEPNSFRRFVGIPFEQILTEQHWRSKWTSAGRLYGLLAIHATIFVLSLFLSLALLFQFNIPDLSFLAIKQEIWWIVPLKVIVFLALGSFRLRWRFLTFADLGKLVQAATISSIAVFVCDIVILPEHRMPASVLLVDWGITIMAIGGSRAIVRVLREQYLPALSSERRRRVLVVGTSGDGAALAQQIHSSPDLKLHVVGFLDMNPAYEGSCLTGIPFLGTPDDVATIAARKHVCEVFVIVGSVVGKALRTLYIECGKSNIRVKMVPPINQLLEGSFELKVRDVEINDLLRREPIELDTAAIADMVQGRRIMVTGAGGSIGSEVCRQILRHHPERLVLLERAENNLFQVERELSRDFPHTPCHACIADVCDEERMNVIFQTHEPNIVFHAAAHKHVPLMESNVGEAIKNNVFGTRIVADLSHKYDVDRFILISTDKVVKPTSMMGISKKLCERYVHSMTAISATRFVVVRFGNVLGSNGSVVPIFQDQIRRGGPVTVTHAEMRRFFMTIPEASQLVLQAATQGNGGEIFVLEMGEPVRIIDLANDLIRLSGFTRQEVQTTIVGVRPGEKLYEEIFDDDEISLPTSHPKLRVVQTGRTNRLEVVQFLDELEPLVNAPDSDLRQKLNSLLANAGTAFSPTNVATSP